MTTRKPQATLILTRLQFADWNTNKNGMFEWAMQRICFGPHPDGVDSHLCIRFKHRTPDMIASARAPDVSSLSSMTATDVVWEVVQQGPITFRSCEEAWFCNSSTPTNFHYEFVPIHTEFVSCMHSACIDLMKGGINYGSNLRYNAVLCRLYSHNCCEGRQAVNCVSSVLLVAATAAVRNSKIARDYEWEEAQVAISNKLILAAYTPYKAVVALISAGIISPVCIRKPTSDIRNVGCRKHIIGELLPWLTMMRV